MGCSSSTAVNGNVSVHERYYFKDKLGQGSFGQVRACTRKGTKESFAVKILDIYQNNEHKSEAQKEAMIWKRVGHNQNVVSLLEVYNDDAFSYFVMERCNRALCDTLLKKKHHLQEFELLDTFRQMLLGLEHCHSKGVIHRDVKPANFLVGFDGHVKLCDFGLAQLARPGGIVGIAGTAPFMSPEMVLKQSYDQKTDMFSVGGTCYIMLYGTYPYQIDKNDKSRSQCSLMRQAIATDCPPPSYFPDKGLSVPSELAKSFVQTLLQRNANVRPSATEALQLPAMRPKQQPSSADRDWAGASSVRSLAPTIQLAKQRTVEFKPQVDPTVAKSMDELIAQLQKNYGGAAVFTGGDFAKSFSLPVDKSAPISIKPTRSHSHSGELPSRSQSLFEDNVSTCSTTASSGSSASKLSL